MDDAIEGSNEVVEAVEADSTFDFDILVHAVAITTLTLAVVSLVLNLNIVCTVWCGSQPRRYGYFHLVAAFCLTHVFYFVLKALFVGIDSLKLLEVELEIDGLQYVPDFLVCVFGTALLLLTTMTSDGLCNVCVRSKPIRRCWRSFSGLVALALGAGVFIGVLAVKFEVFGSCGLSQAAALLIVTAVYLVAFSLVPAFAIVIFGTINWISDRNSSRPVKAARRAARALDRSATALSVPLLLGFLVLTILRFSRDLDVYETQEEADVTKLITEILAVVVDVLFGLYPVLITCSLGRFCCCRANSEDY